MSGRKSTGIRAYSLKSYMIATATVTAAAAVYSLKSYMIATATAAAAYSSLRYLMVAKASEMRLGSLGRSSSDSSCNLSRLP